MPFVPPESDFPQDNQNRTRAELVEEILGSVGGEDDSDQQRRAGFCINNAVREHNTVLWRFNRMRQSITLTAGRDFTLDASFRAPLQAKLLDGSGEEQAAPQYLPYEDFCRCYIASSTTGSEPLIYTVRNGHETGVVTVEPKLVTPLQYPTLRLDYFRRIVLLNGDDDVLNVPEEVEESIRQRAESMLIARVRGYQEAAPAISLARALRNECEAEYRDYPDF